MTLKFNDIVTAADLRPKTAQYLLRSPQYLPKMPGAGTPGVHRQFTPCQARRLAICTRLLQAGIASKYVWPVTRMCETQVVKMEGRKAAALDLFLAPGTDPWKLIVLDDRFARVWREGLPGAHFYNEDEFLDIVTNECEYRCAEEEGVYELSRYVLNLTVLERRLLRMAGESPK